jgi:hypothetical protein
LSIRKGGAVVGFVLIFGDLDRRALDQTDELIAVDVGVYPVAEGLHFPLKIAGEVLGLQAWSVPPVVDLQ